MKLVSFCILTALALIYAGLTVAESEMYQSWERASAEQMDIRSRVAYFQNVDSMLQQLVRRLAIESQRDPAIADLLKQNKIKVIVNQAPSTPEAAPSPPAAAPDKTGAPEPTATPPATP